MMANNFRQVTFIGENEIKCPADFSPQGVFCFAQNKIYNQPR